MPGLVPLLSGLTSGRALCRQARPSPPLRCHPGLDPGSREAGRGRCLWPPDRCPGQAWTPDQVRGDNRGTRTARDGGPRSVSRSGGRAGNPPLPTPCTRSTEVKPDSNGTSPGIHVPPSPRPRPVRTAMPQDVDARNKSGHDDMGTGRASAMTGGGRRSHRRSAPAARPSSDLDKRLSLVWPGGAPGNEKGRRHLRRPHFSTVGNMGRFVSRVKSIFLF